MAFSHIRDDVSSKKIDFTVDLLLVVLTKACQNYMCIRFTCYRHFCVRVFYIVYTYVYIKAPTNYVIAIKEPAMINTLRVTY